jgi:protein-S-isoprenylcysteine O-methyltransferase Ste14
MSPVDWIRYVLASMVVILTPGAVLYWFAVHPFAPFWRRVGHWWGLGAACLTCGVTTWALWRVRHALLAADLGANVVTATIGLGLLVLAVAMRRAVSRQLSLSTLAGLPELAPERYRVGVLDQGIYARIRHPRYLQVMLAMAGYALISNYLAAYAVVAILLVLFAVLIPMEEHELCARLGPDYEAYRRRVPALLPRWRR